MPEIGQQQTVFQFGAYEINPNARELRKHGVKMKLQDQPLQILLLLLEHPGEIVNREQIQQRLWPENTYVDFDNAINSAVRKLREALGDTPENPRFIETLARRGYRFVAPVSQPTSHASHRDTMVTARDDILPVPASPPRPAIKRPRLLWITCALAVAFAAMVIGLRWWISGSNQASRDTPLPAVPLTSYPGFEQFPSFSPDGSRVAFSWDEPGRGPSNIYVKMIGPGDPVRLTTSPNGDFAPAWSPDGRFIAFLRARDALHAAVVIMTAVGGQERELADIAVDTAIIFSHYQWEVPPPFLAWSVDGKWLLALDQAGSGFGRAHAIVRISLGTGEKVSLTFPPHDINGDGSLALSPDGGTLAFTRTFAFRISDIFIAALTKDLQITGNPERLTFDRTEIGGVAWAPDGHTLVFSSARGGRLELWRIAPKRSSKPARLTAAGDDPVDPAVSRQAQRLVYHHGVGGENIWRIALKGNQAGEATNFLPSTRFQGHPKYSPDGKRIAFESNRSGYREIWTCNEEGVNAVQLTLSGNAQSGSPRWSPDGQKIAFDSNAAGNWDIYVINSHGGKPVRLTTSPANEVKPSWSHDGKWIYFSSNRTGRFEIWKIPATGGEQLQVTRNGGYGAFESLDGKTLDFEKGLGLGLWAISTRGGNEISLSESMYLRNFAPAKDGVYFIDRDGHLKFLDSKTGRMKTIIAAPGVVGAEMSISPDERWMLYETSARASELMLIENFH
ncbi:MAG: winged helix-turn-helix domain-containing protein [Bryobacteraceae bacterium]